MNRIKPSAAVVLATLLWHVGMPATGFAAVQSYKNVQGREVLVVEPDQGTPPLPLVIALHGCGQSPDEFLAATGLAALADREGFAIALPPARAGPANPLGCWPWWIPAQQRRDGEVPGMLAATTRAMDMDIDPHRVYVLGLSAGGAMAAILGTVYPDVFAAAGIHSGIGFAAASNTPCALEVMEDGPDRADERGTLAFLHQTTHRIVPTMIIHGDDDDVVAPAHAAGLVSEIVQRNDWIDNGLDDDSFDADPTAETIDLDFCGDDECLPYTIRRFENRDGDAVLGWVAVDGLGHAWSGGAADHSFTDTRGPDAGALFWRFFEDHHLDTASLRPAKPRRCHERWGAPWWHLTWGGTMSLAEYTCNMSPWRSVWRHQIEGTYGPGRCP